VSAHRCLGLLAGALLVAGCATSTPESGSARVLASIDDDLKACTARHGYDPAKTGSLGPHELATGERAWRTCVYQGVEAHVIPQAFAPDAYRRLIARDRELTEQVAAGKITRADRGAALTTAFEEVSREEQAAAAQVMSDPVRRQDAEMRAREMRRRMISPLGR
jgi:hypothetical protein